MSRISREDMPEKYVYKSAILQHSERQVTDTY
jgi:hypothetical protein